MSVDVSVESPTAPASSATAPNHRGAPPDARNQALALAAVVAVNVVLIVLFYNKAWIPADDGQYVHVADRLANGEVLNADIEELHPGYVHFIHAAALKVFGASLVSLRYPLMALMFAQSLGTFWLFRKRSALAAVGAAVTMSSIGILQVANPTPSLYAVALTVGIAAVVLNTTPDSRRRGLAVGALLGAIFLFRQLTAVFVAMGLLAFLCTEQRQSAKPAQRSETVAATVLLGVTLLGLLGYLVSAATAGTAWMFGVGALATMAWSTTSTTITNRELVALLRSVATGVVASALPLVGYHLWNGSLADWLRDALVRSLSVTDLEHIEIGRYSRDLLVPAIRNIVTGSPVERLNGLYWCVLVLAAFALGIRLFAHLRRHGDGLAKEYVVPFLAVFHALVSVFNQIPYYLYLGAGLTVVAWLWMTTVRTPIEPKDSQRRIAIVAFALIALSAVGVIFHAGQPYTRSFVAFVAGERAELVKSELPKMGLWIDPVEERQYQELLAVIDAQSAPDDLLFALPNNAELYFLSERTNPFRIWNPTLGLVDQTEVDAFAQQFEATAPRLIVHDTATGYNTDLTDSLLDQILDPYELVATVDHYQVYRRR